jgi:two-component system, NtrC family, response regulator AtoC
MIKNTVEASRLLVVSRDSAILRPLWSMGESNGWHLEIAADPWEAIDRAQSGATLDLLLLDLPHGNVDGLHSLRLIRRLRPVLPIILIGHPDDNGRKQESVRMGARDYLVRPIEDRQLEQVIQQNIAKASEPGEAEITSDDVELISNDSFFIGGSAIMRRLRAQAALLAEANVSVLILGEDGSGKETAARLVHSLSVRSGFEFAKVNCAALPWDLLERELFGCERKGTIAPARTKTGKVELCARGTIFLDQITEMPPGIQSNLLEVIRNNRFIRPGTSEFVEADVRVVAASSIHVERAVSERKLSEDLYHQLNAYTIHVPSLRDRKEELSLLSRHFMHRLAKRYGLSPREFSPAIIEAWHAYHWPGNLRELERCVKRYLMVGDEELALGKSRSAQEGAYTGVGLARARSVNQIAPSTNQPPTGVSGSKSLRSLVQSVKAEAERNAIAMALEKTGWNRKAAARLLKVSYRTVLYKIEHYKLTAFNSSSFPGTNGFGRAETGFGSDGRSKQLEGEVSLIRVADKRRYGS